MRFSERLAALGVQLETRHIAPGDEAAFADPSEPPVRRRASGAARLAARRALAALGGPADAALPRSPGRFPIWPAGFVGSLAHDEEIAVAAVARSERAIALGADVEPTLPLPEDVAEIVLSASERRQSAADPALGRAIFAAKEAVYKAINPRDGLALEYEDIEVDLSRGHARLRDGRGLTLLLERIEPDGNQTLACGERPDDGFSRQQPSCPGFVPGIHVAPRSTFRSLPENANRSTTWMAGTSPAMTAGAALTALHAARQCLSSLFSGNNEGGTFPSQLAPGRTERWIVVAIAI